MDYIKQLVEKKGPEKSDYHALHVEIERIGTLLDHPSASMQYSDFLDVIFPVLSIETMQGFAFHKPHGYSGDYEIIDRIYRKWKSGKEEFRKWDEFFHAQEAPIAVRNRKKFFLDTLVSSNQFREGMHVLNVGSGPGRDMQEFFQENSDSRTCFDCIDYDRDSIAYARELCAPYLDRIRFFQKNVFRFAPDREYDIIWSAGLFDYLDDRKFVFLLGKLRAYLKPEGTLVIGNFSRRNPTRKYMELFGKWFLYHRSEEELVELARAAGVSDRHIHIFSEPLGVNLFLHVSHSSAPVDD